MLESWQAWSPTLQMWWRHGCRWMCNNNSNIFWSFFYFFIFANDAGGSLKDKIGLSSNRDIEGGWTEGISGRACSQVRFPLLVECIIFYIYICTQAGEENCHGCPCLDCLREDARCHGSQELVINHWDFLESLFGGMPCLHSCLSYIWWWAILIWWIKAWRLWPQNITSKRMR